MKKFLFIAVAALVFAACGNSNSNKEAEQAAVEAAETVETACDSTKCAHCTGCSDSTAVVAADSTVVAE